MLSLYQRRKLLNNFNLTIAWLTMLIGLSALAWILWTLISHGIHGIQLSLFTQNTPAPGSEGGLLNAIVGSFAMTLMAAVIGT
ncbi:MAG: phosphate ABC transporter permease PtsA, partial [Sulfuriferula sp.]